MVDVADVNFKVSLLHKGLLLPAVGVASTGSAKINVSISFDEHPFSLTLIFVYVPAVKPVIVTTPAELEVRVRECSATPFLLY